MATPAAQFAIKTVDETLAELQSNMDAGLASQEADFRRAKYGPNELATEEGESLALKFMEQLKQPLNLLLLGSAFVSLLMGQYDDAFSITLVRHLHDLRETDSPGYSNRRHG
jgi:Ca2+-transporting ATPase